MTTSATGIWLIIAVTAAGLAIFLGSVVLAARQPRRRHGRGETADEVGFVPATRLVRRQ